MIQTTVKLLNGELISVEHFPGKILLEQAIQKVYPEMYAECQTLTDLSSESSSDQPFFFLSVDTVENAITIVLKKTLDVVINTHPQRIQNYDADEFINFIDNGYESYDNVIRSHSVSIGCKSIHKTGVGYFFFPIFHPTKGFTAPDMMHYPEIERYTEDGTREDWYVPKEEDEKKIWFPTFRALFDVLKTRQKFPAIYHNEVFLDKVESAFREYKDTLLEYSRNEQ
jgi:hypothetical protein